MTRAATLVSLAVLTFLPPAHGANPPPTIPSAVVEKQVAKLTTKIRWLASLDEAERQARAQGKPIFWLHALGDLDGTC
jgi:hypothetical protein